ncbi:MAG TPA: hypothetical protein VIY27_02115 [Myxococcota bacterium]
MADRRITFRVSRAEGEDADDLARRRGYVTVGNRPNLSRLMRALLAEAVDREKSHDALADFATKTKNGA